MTNLLFSHRGGGLMEGQRGGGLGSKLQHYRLGAALLRDMKECDT
jgi:hypothetical protein